MEYKNSPNQTVVQNTTTDELTKQEIEPDAESIQANYR